MPALLAASGLLRACVQSTALFQTFTKVLRSVAKPRAAAADTNFWYAAGLVSGRLANQFFASAGDAPRAVNPGIAILLTLYLTSFSF